MPTTWTPRQVCSATDPYIDGIPIPVTMRSADDLWLGPAGDTGAADLLYPVGDPATAAAIAAEAAEFVIIPV